jgi:hypothetical protein
MMKKIYQIPETYIFEKMVVASPLAASLVEDTSNRQAEGTPTTNGLPSGIGETSQTEDPFSDSEGNDKGQGGGGGTTRAKQWTGDWELPNWE